MGRNQNEHLENFHHECGDKVEVEDLEYAKVETLCTIADILEDILEKLKR
jgi:hypothetical protein